MPDGWFCGGVAWTDCTTVTTDGVVAGGVVAGATLAAGDGLGVGACVVGGSSGIAGCPCRSVTRTDRPARLADTPAVREDRGVDSGACMSTDSRQKVATLAASAVQMGLRDERNCDHIDVDARNHKGATIKLVRAEGEDDSDPCNIGAIGRMDGVGEDGKEDEMNAC